MPETPTSVVAEHRPDAPVHRGQLLTGPAFSERVRVETVDNLGPGVWDVGVVGLESLCFRRVTLTSEQLEAFAVTEPRPTYDGDAELLRLGLQAYALGIAYEFDPYFGLSMSKVDPLPHQLEAVYDYLLKLPRVRFLLADDAGAGKTVMAGLLIRELKLRGLAERILIVCPANLTFQWQRELREKFEEKFVVLKGESIREQFGANQWMEQKQILTSLDLAKREDILPGLRQVRWDLVIVDEAHRMSWTPPAAKTARYRLGELLREGSDHYLLLTATPHKGDPESFRHFLQLLDEDAFADVTSIRQAMDHRRAPFYLRRTKEAMVYFPELQPDGTWAASKIFTKREPRTVDFQIDGPEFDLYRDVTRYVKVQSARAAAQGDDPRARAVGFRMSLYQRRLASSVYAVRRSLENGAARLEDRLKRAEDFVSSGTIMLPDPEDLDEAEESERERYEDMVATITLAQNATEVRQEIADLRGLAAQAREVEEAGQETKLTKLETLLRDEGFFGDPSKRLLIFTEFKDTLDYLLARLEAWGFHVGCIHGGMKPGSRDEPGTRLHAEQQFRDGAIQVLACTEAAGEGINLQCCNILFNYDIPWNPNRLEQRMGRIHRYGQRKDCLIFNFVAGNTVEGRVLQTLLAKLAEIRNALDDDSVFNVVGEILPPAHIERVLRDYYAGRMGDADLEDRLLRNVEEKRFRDICQNALEGLATKKLNLEMLIERRAKAQERRLVPEAVFRFIKSAAPRAGLPFRTVPGLAHAFEPGRTPPTLQRFAEEPDWRQAAVATRYPRSSTDREVAEKNNLEWVTPGHPLFEALRRHALDEARPAFAAGTCFYGVGYDAPARLDFYRSSVVDGTGRTVNERLIAVEVREGSEPVLRDVSLLGNLSPASLPGELPEVAMVPEPVSWLNENVLLPALETIRTERMEEVKRIREHVELSLKELILRVDGEIGRAQTEVEQGIQGAEGRLQQAESRQDALIARRDHRRRDFERQQALTLQGLERLASVLILPHPDREAPEMRRLRPNPKTEATAMRVVLEYERSLGREVFDVHEKNLGYDITSLDLSSGELRLIEVKGIGGPTGVVPLTPNERRVAEDRRDCYWLYVVTDCDTEARLQEPIPDPAKFAWREVVKVAHYLLEVDALVQPMRVREDGVPYGGQP